MRLNSNYDLAMQLWGVIKEHTRLQNLKKRTSKSLTEINKPNLGKMAKNIDTFEKEDKVKK